jgi:hypothetical protein
MGVFEMRSLNYVLLGAGAGLLTVVGAQAADLPIKAKPVEYVKVCNSYGAGFFYIPGTDTCLKVGGYLRADHTYGDGGNQSAYYLSNANARHDRLDTDTYGFRARMNLTVDFRTQSDYGTIRAYAAIIAQQSQGDASANGSAGILRAFIQFAGFTAGHAESMYEFFQPGNYTYRPPSVYSGWTGDNGIDLIAYTWQIGNGFSASIDIEDGGDASAGTFGTGRGKWLVNASNAAQLGSAGAGAAGFAVVNDALRAMQPDVVGNLRVDQAWGSAQIMGAIHNASGGYYSNFPGLVAPAAGVPPGLNPGSTVFGHPGETWGWAAGAGIRLVNFLLPKDTIEAQVNYAKGAMGYVLPMNGSTSYVNDFVYGSGNNLGMAYAPDGVFVNGSQVDLTEAWSVSAAYQHYWSPQWRTSVIGGYSQINFDSFAQGMLCGTAGGSAAFALYGTLVAGSSITNCNPNFSLASVSTRTAWNPHPFLEIGLDLIWNHVQTANAGSIVNLLPSGGRPGGLYTVANQDNYFAMMRFQKNILP